MLSTHYKTYESISRYAKENNTTYDKAKCQLGKTLFKMDFVVTKGRRGKEEMKTIILEIKQVKNEI